MGSLTDMAAEVLGEGTSTESALLAVYLTSGSPLSPLQLQVRSVGQGPHAWA